jgi:hypothetical protein
MSGGSVRSHKIDLAARKSWCESNDPNFTAKAADIVGLYVAPPTKAIVLCVDEKPSIQALERALLHKPQTASGSHRCLRQRIQRHSQALRLDQEKNPSTSFQRPPYHSALILGTSQFGFVPGSVTLEKSRECERRHARRREEQGR